MISIDSHVIQPTVFPDKTSQVWHLSAEMCLQIVADKHVKIDWQFENESEIFHICQLCDLLRSYCPDLVITLHAPYLPYARQDKSINNNNTFALFTFVGLMRNYVNKIICFDLHCWHDVLEGFITVQSPDHIIRRIIKQYKYDYTIYPDESAAKRYILRTNKDFVLLKQRDPETGYITMSEPLARSKFKDLQGQRCLIVDDICDGGMTFKLAAEAIHKNTKPKCVDLYCSHLILSKGVDTLYESGITNIYSRKGLEYSK